MYSKAHSPRPPRPPMPRTPYGGSMTGGPSYRQRVRVPPNYSGNAIVDGEERTPGMPVGVAGEASAGGEEALRYVADRRPGEPPDEPRPYFDTLPRVGVSSGHRSGYFVEAEASSEADAPTVGDEPSEQDDRSSAAAVSVVPPARRSVLDSTHFPFGHGIGSEELLLLGLMYFLFREGALSGERGDLDETLILLGILLLCG